MAAEQYAAGCSVRYQPYSQHGQRLGRYLQLVYRDERPAGIYGRLYLCSDEHGVSEAVVAQKQAVNTALFDASTAPEEVLRLCAENGIDYLVCSKQYPGDTSQLSGLVVVYENADVTIYAAD